MCLACCAFGFKIAIELRYLTMCKISSSLGWSNLLELFIVRRYSREVLTSILPRQDLDYYFFLTVVIVQKRLPSPGDYIIFLAFHTPLHRIVIVCVCFAEAARHQAGRGTQI